MDAAALVALAREVAQKIRYVAGANPEAFIARHGARIRVIPHSDMGFVWMTQKAFEAEDPAPYFEIDLTTENVASEDALMRALLASAITFDVYEDGTIHYARLGDRSSGPYPSVPKAREALLDALLGEVTA